MRSGQLLHLLHRTGCVPGKIIKSNAGEYAGCFRIRTYWILRAGSTALTWQTSVLESLAKIPGIKFERVACSECWADFPKWQESYFEVVVKVLEDSDNGEPVVVRGPLSRDADASPKAGADLAGSP